MTPDDLFLPSSQIDPYPVYAALRAQGPVLWSDAFEGWVVTRYAEIVLALKDGRLSSRRSGVLSPEVAAEVGKALEPFRQSLRLWALFRDPPDHTRLRALIQKAFAPALVEKMRGRVSTLVEELIAPRLEAGRLDVLADVAEPLPAIVIAEILGVRAADRTTFKRWSDDLAAFFVPGQKTRQQTERGLSGWHELTRYLASIVNERRREPADDLISAMLAAEERGSILSEDELLATAALLIFAGHETTTNLIANGILALLEHPAAERQLRDNPELITPAVEEMLRYDGPVHVLVRLVKEDFTLGGQMLRAGERLILLVASANRDPEQFPDADTFRLDRRENRHLAFGLGIHFCVGAALARLEAREAIAALLRAMPRMTRADHPITYGANFALRRPDRLEIRFHAGA